VTRAEAEGHARGLRRAAPEATDLFRARASEARCPCSAAATAPPVIQGERRADMQWFIRAMLAKGRSSRGSVRVQVDIDPQSFL